MTELKKMGYETPASIICELQNESVICISSGIDDLKVKDTQEWGWEE
jgi:hypothetical protein